MLSLVRRYGWPDGQRKESRFRRAARVGIFSRKSFAIDHPGVSRYQAVGGFELGPAGSWLEFQLIAAPAPPGRGSCSYRRSRIL